MLSILFVVLVNGFALVLAGFVFFGVGLGGKLFLLLFMITSFILPFLFRGDPDAFYVFLLVTHLARFMLGAGCFIYLKARGDI